MNFKPQFTLTSVSVCAAHLRVLVCEKKSSYACFFIGMHDGKWQAFTTCMISGMGLLLTHHSTVRCREKLNGDE